MQQAGFSVEDAFRSPGQLMELGSMLTAVRQAVPKLEAGPLRYLAAELRRAEAEGDGEGVSGRQLQKLIERVTAEKGYKPPKFVKLDKNGVPIKDSSKKHKNGPYRIQVGVPGERRDAAYGEEAEGLDQEWDVFPRLAAACRDQRLLQMAFEEFDSGGAGAVPIELMPELASALVPDASESDLTYVDLQFGVEEAYVRALSLPAAHLSSAQGITFCVRPTLLHVSI